MSTPSPEALLGLLAELDRVRALAVALVDRSASPLSPTPPEDAPEEDRALFELLVRTRRAVFGNPSAARRVYDLLAAEGRRYAATPSGAELRDALVASEAVDHLRRIWDTVSLSVLEGPAPPTDVPDAWAEMLADLVMGQTIDDTVLARLRPEGYA
jgi:hypothetical protein